jgi:UDP-N-acetylmuramate dehydrogenase
MTPTRRKDKPLIERLPTVRGRYTADAPLAATTWFRVGGPAEVLFRPADVEDLAQFLALRPAELDVTVIGVGSNLLVRDGGVSGVVIRLGRGFAAMRAEGGRIHAGAGALDINVALTAEQAGLTDLEFLSGIPGTIGGALRMNAGAYGSDMSAVAIEATAIDPHGRQHRLGHDDLGFSYRRAGVPEGWIFVAAVLQGRQGDPQAIANRMRSIREQREAAQPVRARTGGSTFANPDPTVTQKKAWQLIDEAGCRGLTRGGARVSEKHCNFLINTGDATAADIEGLGEEVRRRVHDDTGVTLNWEIRRIGVPLKPAARTAVTGAAR